jgi:hypothetical protein
MVTLPYLSSKMLESPMNELLEVNLVHFVSLPTVPLPSTGRLDPVDVGVMLNEVAPALLRMSGGIRLKPKRGRRLAWVRSVES